MCAAAQLEGATAEPALGRGSVTALAVYEREAGLGVSSGNAGRSGGTHAEVGLRCNLASLVELRGAVGHYDRDGDFDEVAASVLFHLFPFLSLDVATSRTGPRTGGAHCGVGKQRRAGVSERLR